MWISMILVFDISGAVISEIKYTEPLETKEICETHAIVLATDYMTAFWNQENVDHNNIPRIEMHCREED